MSSQPAQSDVTPFPGQPLIDREPGEGAGEAGPASAGGGGGGNASVGLPLDPAEVAEVLAHAREADKLAITKRFTAEGRWTEIEPIKTAMLREARRAGWTRADAQAWAYWEVDRQYPPLPEPEPVDCDNVPPAPASVPASDGLSGLHDVPDSWPELPAGSSLQAELQWVQSNRLAVVEERSPGVTVVHLDRAHEPAPSRAALGWLETSIRSYAKYVDVVARTLRDEADEAETVRRERLAITDIRELLSEMTEHAAS